MGTSMWKTVGWGDVAMPYLCWICYRLVEMGGKGICPYPYDTCNFA
jgi:hypothetical protein